jgi:hypothetical protein
MEMFGYEKGSSKLLTLGEVSSQASPAILRKVAEFILTCADEMERNENWEHRHFSDFLREGSIETEIEGLDLIVAAEMLGK